MRTVRARARVGPMRALPTARTARRRGRRRSGRIDRTTGRPDARRGLRGLSGRPARRRDLLVVLGCLPGLLAVLVLALCTHGFGRTAAAAHSGHTAGDATGDPARPLAAYPAPAHTAVRPAIVPRSAWAEDDARARPAPRYDDRVVAVFVHHTDSPNGYDCADAPRIIRYLAAGQTGARQWDDIGYNFLVDRCGTIYEGRAGGVDRPVTGAHTQGFNHRTAGVAAIGTFTAGTPVPRAMTDAIAALAAWKLGLSDTDPRTAVRLVSSNSLSRYANGTAVQLPAVAGHRDGYMTSCPGEALSALLPEIRDNAARLQGRWGE
ncbi:N-acetylmuramoyl-L-alanine amidase family 2 [Actinobacteria bacterium OK074]|nr:N-acetylmuramoyl-L-alanine amidase family 2 [Actinobacteria bacterium OK074]